ncbi:phage portal protein [Altericroceibacterium spongiae]|uniref:Phage portal protein n=1 Tax=Altericroceibacterium spongiae TaxID=2320269 RepID=A0A420EPY2_9SPHN|nr:phage portal protein [Altericroceibacterium spongiae]RKF22721.1 phage portal protein [Altericroceibacterium spongiae]
MNLFDRIFGKRETRSTSGTGYTSQIMAAREAYVAGRTGLGELTATVQTCVSLWESGLSIADVRGTDLLSRFDMCIAARSLALRGEAVFLIRDRLIPIIDWDLSTRDGIPRAYRVSVPEIGGGRSETALAAEVLHFRLAPDPGSPWTGQAPLRRSQLTAGLLHTLEAALAEVYENAPLGSQVVPFPESPDVDLETLGLGFRGRRGRVMLRESVNVTAAGGPVPSHDWRPQDVTPSLQGSMAVESLADARGAIFAAFGVLPAMFAANAQGPLVREAQRHLAQWVLQPMAQVMAEECTAKLATPVTIDVVRPAQAFDAGGRARAFGAMVTALTQAKEAGLDPQAVEDALSFIDWAD